MLAGRIDVQFRVRGSKGASSCPSSPLPPSLSPSLTRSLAHHLLPPSPLATSLLLLASRSRRHRVLYLDPPRQGRPLRGPALESDARRRRRARPAGARLDAADPGARVGCAEGEGRGAEQGGVGSGEARTAGEARGGPGRNPCFRRCSAAASLSRAEHDSERASRGVGASREHFVMVVLSGLARSLALAPPRRSSTCSRSPSTRSLAIDEPPQNWGVYQRCLNARVISGVVEAPPDCVRGRGRGGVSSCAQGSLGGLNQKPGAARRGCAEQGEQDGRARERATHHDGLDLVLLRPRPPQPRRQLVDRSSLRTRTRTRTRTRPRPRARRARAVALARPCRVPARRRRPAVARVARVDELRVLLLRVLEARERVDDGLRGAGVRGGWVGVCVREEGEGGGSARRARGVGC